MVLCYRNLPLPRIMYELMFLLREDKKPGWTAYFLSNSKEPPCELLFISIISDTVVVFSNVYDQSIGIVS